MKLQIFSGTQNKALAEDVASQLGTELGGIYHRQFPSGETWCQYQENIRENDIFLFEPITKPANESLMRILIMADAARRASAGRITAVIPYYGYARQDRKDKSRVPISAKLVMDMIQAAGINRVLTMDLHNPAIQGFTNMPVDHLYAMPLFFKYLNLKGDVVFAAPDVGAIKRTEDYVKSLKGSTMAVCPKTRIDDETVTTHELIGDVKGKTVFLLDDIAESCGTILGAAKMCRQKGAKKVFACITHGLFTEVGYQRLGEQTDLDGLYVTDSVDFTPPVGTKIQKISCANLFASAIKNIHEGTSVSQLFL